MARLGPSFDLGTLYSSSNGEAVDVATLTNGQIVALGDEALVPLGGGITDDEGIVARLYTDSGTPVSAVFQVHGDVDLSEYRPAVTALTGGGFVITWHHNADFDFATGFFGVDIWAQVFDASGNMVGDAIEIVADDPIGNSTADDQSLARPVALTDGGFIVTWEQGDGESAMGQRYNASGAPVGAAVELFDTIGQAPNAIQFANGDVAAVNDSRAGNQQDPTITVTDDGNYFIAHIDTASSGNPDEVRGVLVTTGDTGGTDPVDPDPVTPVIDGKTLTGTKGANRLVGGAKNDEINGGKENDKLFGKAGDDLLKGGTGNARSMAAPVTTFSSGRKAATCSRAVAATTG